MNNEVDPEFLKELGQALNGRHWQADMARETFLSKSQITRYMSCERTPDEAFKENLHRILVDKLEDVTAFLGHPALPRAKDNSVKAAKKAIKAAIAILRKTAPAVERHKIEPETPRKRITKKKSK